MRLARVASFSGSCSADIAEPMYLARWPSGWSAQALAGQRGDEGGPRIVHRTRLGVKPDARFPLRGARTTSFLNVEEAAFTR